MEIKPVVSRITIFPIKSLDGVVLQKAMITEGGCLLHDREYAITDSNGKFIIGKNNNLIYSLRSKIDFDNELISFRHNDTDWNEFNLLNDKPFINSYLSGFFGIEVELQQNKHGRFLDIPDLSGITLGSSASLQTISGWFNLDMEQTRKRFRMTVEMEGVPPFWEDHLFIEEGAAIEFTMGEVTLLGMSPRARCSVPTHHPETGEVIHAFPKTFAKHRAELLPAWSNLKAYGHFYHLTVDCHIPATETGKWINVGDEVKIVGEKVGHVQTNF